MKIISLTLLIAIPAIFAIAEEFPICTDIYNQGAPDVAFVGNEYIVVYDSVGDIWAARIDLRGNVLERFFIHTPEFPDCRDTFPAVATDGERWFVVWTARSSPIEEERFLGIWGAVYEGSTVIVEPFMIETGATSFPDISCNGDIFLICGTVTLLSIPQKSFLKGRFYDRDGNPLLTDILIDSAGGQDESEDGYLGYPTISSDGDRFIVVYPWCQWFYEENTQHAIKYKFVTPDGSVEDGGVLFSKNTRHYSVPSSRPPENIPKLYVIPPDISFNGINYFCSHHVLENYLILPYDGYYNMLGAVINQAGEILLNEIPIAVVENISEFASGVIAEYENFFVVWQDSRAGNFNIYGRHYSQDGKSILDEIVLTEAAQDQTLPSVAFDDLNIIVVWQDYRNYNWDIWGNLLHKGWTDDPLALAYNGNRHLVRMPNSQELHLIYTDHYYDGHRKVIYQCSSNGGTDWSLPEIIGSGKYPAIALNSNYLPSVTWTDNSGGLWYGQQAENGVWTVYHLYDPTPGIDPCLTSPPSMTITSSEQGDTVHILVTLERDHPIIAGIAEYDFPIQDPSQGEFVYIEGGPLSSPKYCFYPSIEKDFENRLHAVWQRGDTICYATRDVEQSWFNWGPEFNTHGLQSAHPFVETYGDSVFVVWQRNESPVYPEEIYRAASPLGTAPPNFTWSNLSQTQMKTSLYPVNASGLVTTFVDESELIPPGEPYEIYWKTKPDDPLNNISQSPNVKSIYPHTDLRFNQIADNILYVIWQEGNASPYQILSKRVFVPSDAPPLPPLIIVNKDKPNDVVISWNQVTTDTLGNPDTARYYIVYRDTFPCFIPGPSNSIDSVFHPETTYTDLGALNASQIYHYLVKAVDDIGNKSKKSNMGYVFHKFVNENPEATSKNWVSLPFINEYDDAEDLTSDLSPSGDPLTKITNLRDDQLFENWSFTTIPFPRWTGVNFAIESGRGYEVVANIDDTLAIVGSNDPDGLIHLIGNPDATNKNWVSIPYNAVYSTVSDITNEYSASGDPLVKITNLRDDQLFENWTFTTIPFPRWTGVNFAIESGRGYEFVTAEWITDTTWNPTEYSNEAESKFLAKKRTHESRAEMCIGSLTEPDRTVPWFINEAVHKPVNLELNEKIDNQEAAMNSMVAARLEKKIDYNKADMYEPVSETGSGIALRKWDDHREAGVSHLIRGYLELRGLDNLVFTAYRPEQPNDVLTENMVGCGIAKNNDFGLFWCDVGNFKKPWKHGEEAMLIVEATRKGEAYYDIIEYELDEKVDIQELRDIELKPYSELILDDGSICLDAIDQKNIVGYSLYKNDRRLNEKVLSGSGYSIEADVDFKLVIIGGHETVYGLQATQNSPEENIPKSYSLSISPNPFVTQTLINYALPKETTVEIVIYDVIGRQVKTLASELHNPGYYFIIWNGTDNKSRKMASGIYFIRFEAGDYTETIKLLLMK